MKRVIRRLSVFLFMVICTTMLMGFTASAKQKYGIPTFVKYRVMYGFPNKTEMEKYKIRDIKTSNSKVLTFSKASKPKWFKYEYWLNVKKPGTATVSWKATDPQTKKTSKFSYTYVVFKYSNPFKSIKIGKTNLTKRFKKSQDADGLKVGLSGKLSIKLKSGWKLTKVQYLTDGKVKTISKNSNIKFGENEQIWLTLKNTKKKFTITMTLGTVKFA